MPHQRLLSSGEHPSPLSVSPLCVVDVRKNVSNLNKDYLLHPRFKLM